MGVRYDDVADAVSAVGMRARGAFEPTDDVPALADGTPAAAVVVIGNVGGEMWPHFRGADVPPGPDPLDRWTRSVLGPIATRFGAEYVHPSDEPYRPFQRWAQLADDVWPSPIGLLIHARSGLWHAYRGAFLFPASLSGMPATGLATSPCLTCADRPCLTTCPVDAFGPEGYDVASCADHVASGGEPTCLDDGCAARLACPVGVEHRYGPDQMRFHMRAFLGARG